jgi:hypothetical protein
MVRSLAAIALSLVLALTAGAFAVARGQGAVAGRVEICTGNGPVMVARDADGNPTGHPHICPDAAFFVVDGAVPPIPGRVAAVAGCRPAFAEPLPAGRVAPARRARDPPPPA